MSTHEYTLKNNNFFVSSLGKISGDTKNQAQESAAATGNWDQVCEYPGGLYYVDNASSNSKYFTYNYKYYNICLFDDLQKKLFFMNTLSIIRSFPRVGPSGWMENTSRGDVKVIFGNCGIWLKG